MSVSTRRGSRSVCTAVAGWAFLLAAAFARPAPAQAPPAPPASVPAGGEKILRVEIRGLRHQPEARVKALLESREGRTYDKQVVSEDLHRLIERGFFSHIEQKVEPIPGGVALVFTVVENDRVAAVELAGVKRQDAKVLRDALRIKTGEFYDPFKVRRDLDALRETYKEKGFPFVDVAAAPPEPGPDGVTVRYLVVEGPEVSVTGVRFTGTFTADTGILEDKLRMKPPAWIWRIFTSTAFVEREAKDDVERLKAHFRLEGWLDAEVTLEDLEYAPDKSGVTVVFHVEEGPAYRVRKLDVRGNALFTPAEILGVVSLEPGGPFTERELNASRQRIVDKYHERAYILVEVDPQRAYAKEAAEVDLLFDIREQGRIYLDRLVIQGNTKTRDDVIRRTLGVAPGEEYNKVALEKGIRRLRDLQYFDRVNFREEAGSAPDRRNLVVEVSEVPTGQVRFAAGYSSSYGVVGHIGLNQRNFDLARSPDNFDEVLSGEAFAGGGQNFSVDFMPGTQRSSISVGFYEPYVFGEPYGFSARGYDTVARRSYGYTENRLGGRFGVDRRFFDSNVKVGVSLRIENIKIFDLDSNVPDDVRAVEGLNQIRSVIPQASLDFRDSYFKPTEGGSAKMSVELAGSFLGGDFDYSKTRIDADYHIPLYTTPRKFRHVLSFGASFGWMGYMHSEADVPIFERFYAGGGGEINGLRGFGYREAGPHQYGEPTGGRALLLGSAEYHFPIYEDVLRGGLFIDVGDLEHSLRGLDLDRFRVSTGAGIKLTIPQLGGGVPLALYYGIPIRMMEEDDRSSIYFDVGFPF
jgi:outer membrane protein insertion porin family